MDQFKAVVNKATWYEQQGEVYGEIHIELNDIAFPSSRWTDHSLRLGLCWYIVMEKVINSKRKIGYFIFMDDPYYFTARRKGKESIEIKLFNYKHGIKNPTLMSETPYLVDINQFRESLTNMRNDIVSDRNFCHIDIVKRFSE